jgi:hypothetical protein
MIHVLFAASANAEPCVGPAYDRPFPGAVDVTMHYADVPAAQFPGIWQDGMIEGHFYQIFANRLAVLKADRTAPVWSINLNCQQRPCTITAAGNPPATALSTSSRLKQCLEPPESKIAVSPDAHSVPAANAPSMPAPAEAAPQPSAPEIAATAVPAPVALKPANPAPDKPAPRVAATGLGNPAPEQELPPKADAVENPATFAETTAENVPLAGYSGDIRLEPIASDATNPSPGGQPIALTGNAGTEITCPRPHSETIPLVVASCRSAVIPGSDPVATLQQLLVMAGADPGDVDGLYGGKTEGAVLEVLGYRGRNLDVSEAIDAIDAFLCGQEP